MKLPRWAHRFRAWLTGYFWIPCPRCGRYFGGHESSGDIININGSWWGTCCKENK